MSGKSADGTPGRLEAQRRLGTQGRMLNLAMTGLSSAAAARLGLQAIDQQCIGLLHQAGGMTVGRLAQLAGLTASSITGVVDRLEKAGLARRESDPQDRRRVLVVPLPSDEARAVFAPMAERMAGLQAEYTLEQLDLIAGYMERAVAIMHEVTATMREAAPDE
jgi:DNA-binding MarR family transcriptional regulator